MDGAPTIRSRRGEFVRSVGIALVVTLVLAGAYWKLRPTAPAPPPPARPTAADLAAPAALQRAAAQIGFHPTTEPGVGSIESQPASAANPPDNTHLLAVGSTAPAFALRTPEGATVSLAAQRGKVVLLEFFATWCPHCDAEAPHLARLARSYADRPVQFVAITADSENAASLYAYHRYFGLPYPVLLDPGTPAGSFHQQGGQGPVTHAYDALNYPTFYVIDKTGVIRFRTDREQPDAALENAIDAALR